MSFSFCLSAGREITELYSFYVCERSVFYWRSSFFTIECNNCTYENLKIGCFTDIKSVFLF